MILTPFALAMPDEYKSENQVESYRNYYMSPEKQKIATWKKKEIHQIGIEFKFKI